MDEPHGAGGVTPAARCPDFGCRLGAIHALPAGPRRVYLWGVARPERIRLVLVLVLLSSVWPSVATAWLSRVAGTGDAGDAHFHSPEIATTPAGDVVFAGTLAAGVDMEIAALFVDGATGEELWRYTDGAPIGQAIVVATDAAGDVALGGFVRDAVTGDQELAVRKLAGTTGAELWAYDRGSATGSQAEAIGVDAAGDVFVGGLLDEGGATGDDFFVAKLDGATGVEDWAVTIDGGAAGERAAAIALGPSGNVIAMGRVALDLIVVELDGATGAELWRYTEGGSLGTDVAADASGDVVVSGIEDAEFLVLKIDGTSGTEIWRHRNAGATAQEDRANAVVVDASGDVIAVGEIDSDPNPALLTTSFFVVKLDGASGAEEWTHARTGSSATALDVAVDPGGAVFAAGTITHEDTNGHGRFGLVERLDGATGSLVWAHRFVGTALRSTSPGANRIESIALDPLGDVAVTGDIREKKGFDDFGAMKLDADDGSMASLDGRKLVVKGHADPAKRAITFVAKSPVVQSPPPGAIGDPSVAGATFRLWNPSTLEEATFFLPPGAEWKGLGKPKGTLGWKYLDKSGDHGPCVKLQVNAVKQVKVTCKGKRGVIPFTLDEASQGSLAASVQFGLESPQCAEFGGLVVKDEPGIFKAKSAAPLAACP